MGIRDVILERIERGEIDKAMRTRAEIALFSAVQSDEEMVLLIPALVAITAGLLNAVETVEQEGGYSVH